MHCYQISSTISIFRSKVTLIKNDILIGWWNLVPKPDLCLLVEDWLLCKTIIICPPLFQSHFCTFFYQKTLFYFYFPKWRYKPRMMIKTTNSHIIWHLSTYWLYLLEYLRLTNLGKTMKGNPKFLAHHLFYYIQQKADTSLMDYFPFPSFNNSMNHLQFSLILMVTSSVMLSSIRQVCGGRSRLWISLSDDRTRVCR